MTIKLLKTDVLFVFAVDIDYASSIYVRHKVSPVLH